MIEPAPLPSISLAVVGVAHANADKSKSSRLFEIKLCAPGDPVELRPEPKNVADEHAIAVFSSRGVQIGYITAERAPRLGAIIRSGREVDAVFQREAPFGAWIRVAFDGEVPLVPAEAPAPAGAPGSVQTARVGMPIGEGVDPDFEFQPDPEWPD